MGEGQSHRLVVRWHLVIHCSLVCVIFYQLFYSYEVMPYFPQIAPLNPNTNVACCIRRHDVLPSRPTFTMQLHLEALDVLLKLYVAFLQHNSFLILMVSYIFFRLSETSCWGVGYLSLLLYCCEWALGTVSASRFVYEQI